MTLKTLAIMGCLEDYHYITGSSVGKKLGVSQQVSSRWLRELEEMELITVVTGIRKRGIIISSKGEDALRKEYMDYKNIFSKENRSIILEGGVTSGFGEGGYYIYIPEYKEQIETMLGYTPFRGTLNIRINNHYTEHYHRLLSMDGKKLSGFHKNGRTYGDVKIFEATVNEDVCAVLIPERTHHDRILEVIAPFEIRKKYNLIDGMNVKIKVFI